MSTRQLAALLLALEHGYYEQPPSCSISDLAELTTVARATFEEHLRKAENKPIRNAGQFVRLLNQTKSEVGLVDGRNCSIAPGV